MVALLKVVRAENRTSTQIIFCTPKKQLKLQLWLYYPLHLSVLSSCSRHCGLHWMLLAHVCTCRSFGFQSLSRCKNRYQIWVTLKGRCKETSFFFFSPDTTRNQWRRSLPLGSSVTSATVSTFTTLRTVPHRLRCPTPLHTPLTMAVRARSGPTATSVRSLATGLTPVTTTRPFEAYSLRLLTQSISLHIVLGYVVLLGSWFVYMHFVCFSLPLVLKHSYRRTISLESLFQKENNKNKCSYPEIII